MATVSVACKIPNGLIIRHGGKEAVLNGPNVSITKDNNWMPLAHLTPGGYGLTHEVDEALWQGFSTEYKDSDFIKNGLVFASAKPSDTAAKSVERKNVKSGLERIDPDKPGPGIERVAKED
jgi:hypothetical protein